MTYNIYFSFSFKNSQDYILYLSNNKLRGYPVQSTIFTKCTQIFNVSQQRLKCFFVKLYESLKYIVYKILVYVAHRLIAIQKKTLNQYL